MSTDFDPVAASATIVGDYQRYLRTLLPLADQRLASALNAAIEDSPLLMRGPIVEGTPAYARGASLRDLIHEGVLPEKFLTFDSPDLPVDRPLYVHQEVATRKAREGRSLVVSTGTGSGKTEAFLIPILARLADELTQGALSPGVRALLLYPMNALANDQMKRLRHFLALVPEVTFGRYIGDTPHSPAQAARTFEQLNPNEPRLPNELLSREEMQATPPHLLLTNYAMLEYLLLRPADMDLFEGEYGGHWRFIVVDEAHVYDGARGSELAMLLRRLRERVSTSQLQCIATSATVGQDSQPQAVTDFAQALFDSRCEWVPSDPARQDLVSSVRIPVPAGTWGALGPEDYRHLAHADSLSATLTDLSARSGVSGVDSYDLLARERTMSTLRQALASGAQSVTDLKSTLGTQWTASDLDSLIKVGGQTRDSTGVPLLSARYHLWLRSTEGAFTCASPTSPHVSLARQEVCIECQRPAFELACCTRCGTTYLVGHENSDEDPPRLEPRVGTVMRPTWVALTDETHADDEDEDVWDESELEVRDAVELCAECGCLCPQGSTSCASCGTTQLRSGRVVRGHAKELTGCVVCGSRSHGQVRLFDTGADAAAAVVATSLYQELPPVSGVAGDNPGGGRKLLAFSDSRQGAAYFAPYLNRSYQTILQRRLLLQGIDEASQRDRGPSLLDDVIANTARNATDVEYFARRTSRQAKERAVGLWLSQELVAFDTRQSLEGLGLVEFTLDDTDRIAALPVWPRLNLLAENGVSFIQELARMIRLQGAISFPEGVDPADEAFAPRLGPIFVREQGSDKRLLSWLPTRGTNRRLDYTTRVLQRADSSADPTETLAGIWKMLTMTRDPWLVSSHHRRHGVVFQVDHSMLVAQPRAGDAATYRCDTCAQVSSRSVLGVCPTFRCPGTLSPVPSADVYPDHNHYRHLYRELHPFPLSVEEHTAQWAATEAAEIQNRFIRGEINALSCSTTFELGVDVGELQAVLLRNVPPGTANYVQRAGRAGRRTASAALVVTFAQRRSHDLSRFQDPMTMINGIVTPPIIPLGNDRIDRRHAHSVALAQFFRHEWLTHQRLWRKVGDFFAPEAGEPQAIDLVEAFLKQPPASLDAALSAILPANVQREIGLAAGAWKDHLVSMLATVRVEVRSEVDYFEEARQEAFDARNDGKVRQLGRVLETIRKRDLLGFLGSRNILPKYGFPVDVVELRTQASSNSVGQRLDLSRDLSTAVFEYAPGSQIVAGGWMWTSAGVYRLPDRDLVHGYFAECPHCQYFEAGLAELAPTCPECAGDRRPQKYVIPEFGFIADRDPVKPGGSPPQRSWSGGTYFVEAGQVVRSISSSRRAGGPTLSLEASQRAKLMAVSTSPSRQGFLICEWCGRGVATTGKTPRSHTHAWKEQECRGPLDRASLAHSYETDVLTIDFPAGLITTQERAWSTLYGLLDGAAHVLGIARDDIDGTLWFAGGHPRLILFDSVPGGAGCVLQIPDRIHDIVERTRAKLASCECGIDTSCYSCLRTYRNQIRHHLLSRGEALAFLEAIQ